MLELRPYQQDLRDRISHAWEQSRNVIARAPTGSGKTVLFSSILHDHLGASCTIAHRQELVSQISLALAQFGVSHRVIGQRSTVQWINRLHRQEVGRSYIDPNARCAVAGVDTLIRRRAELESWRKQVTLWVTDEAHHVLRDNKWGSACEMFPNARGLGVTATPGRADGRGLGRHADGVFDVMVSGPSMRELIEQKFLTEYRIFAPASDLDLSSVNIGASGDYNQKQLRAATQRSHLVGDVVDHYCRIAPGKRGVTFVSSVDAAHETAARFNAKGVVAAALSAKTPDPERVATVREFREGRLLQLVNVDLFGEGFDLPAIEVCSMARPTESYALFVQQFGRALRPLEGKAHAIIIDHVGNVVRHGLPDAPRKWTLDRRDAKAKKDPDKIPMRVCVECTAPFERFHKTCPWCGAEVILLQRSEPIQVDGDLTELDAETLAAMRGEIERVDEDPVSVQSRVSAAGHPTYVAMGAANRHRRRQEAQAALRGVLAIWGGLQQTKGRSDAEAYQRFYWKFGIDVYTAQTLGQKDAYTLMGQIIRNMGEKQ